MSLLKEIHHYKYASIFSNTKYRYGFDNLISLGNESLDALPNLSPTEPISGFITYDYKNKVEKLISKNPLSIKFPELFFFRPDKYDLFDYNEAIKLPSTQKKKVQFTCNFTKEEYIKIVNKLKEHIVNGDIYEINFCIEFTANEEIDPLALYIKTLQENPKPFSSFFKYNNKYMIGASPERYIQKDENKLFSNPIKGTAPRGATKEEDSQLKTDLYKSEKERAENLMIVDLVRNDLSKIGIKGTTKVEELFGLYTFPTVHQMISTVSCEVDTSFENILNGTFPMGSMTGAPKVMSMKLIERYEKSTRGLYSGATGYLLPNGDFDFNVVIRSLIYDADTHRLSLHVGGAITYSSDPEQEYEECLLKAKSMFELLG